MLEKLESLEKNPSRGTTNIDINLMVDDYKERFSIKCRKKKENKGKGQSEQRNQTLN